MSKSDLLMYLLVFFLFLAGCGGSINDFSGKTEAERNGKNLDGRISQAH